MSEVSDLAYKDYLDGTKYKDIAEKYSVSLNTVKSWKQRYKWSRKGVHTNKKVCIQKRKGGQPGNKNGTGPPGNKNAETHGFFSKIFPPETIDIVEDIMIKDSLDMLWENIIIQYTAIARSQRIMNVKNQDDLTKELKRQKESSGDASDSWEKEYELQFAWNKQATFLQAQSRAMSELRNLIKQYDETLHAKWELATEEQKLRIEKLKVDIEKVKSPENNKPIEVVIKRKSEE